MMYDGQELMHFGIKGMKWGVRRYQNKDGSLTEAGKRREARKDLVKSYKEDKGPTRFGVVNAANSAARTYYRKERTKSFSEYRKQEQKLNLKMARLTQEQISNGRYRVANARNIRRKTLSAVLGTAAGVALVTSGAGLVGVPAAAAVATVTNFASGGHYYATQKRAYGDVRAKYQTQKKRP